MERVLIYLKSVILEIEQEAAFGDGTGRQSAAECMEEWRKLLESAGMEVTALPTAAQGGQMEGPGRKESDASLWITDDPSRAKEHLLHDEAVLGLIYEGDNRDFGKVSYLCMNLKEVDAVFLDRVYRRYRSLPWDILETARCFVRETTTADVDAFYEIYRDPRITEFMENLFEDRDEEIAYTKDYVKNVYEFYGHGVWTVCLKNTGVVIGRAGLSFREGYEEPELGFVIGTKWQGEGLASEVCGAILELGMEEFGYTEYIAFSEPGNVAAHRVLEKLGFSGEGKTKLFDREHFLFRKQML